MTHRIKVFFFPLGGAGGVCVWWNCELVKLQQLQDKSSTSSELHPWSCRLENAQHPLMNSLRYHFLSLVPRYRRERHQLASISVTLSELRQHRQQKKEIYNDLVVPTALLRHPDFPGHYIRERRTREQLKVPVRTHKTNTALEFWFPGSQVWWWICHSLNNHKAPSPLRATLVFLFH